MQKQISCRVSLPDALFRRGELVSQLEADIVNVTRQDMKGGGAQRESAARASESAARACKKCGKSESVSAERG